MTTREERRTPMSRHLGRRAGTAAVVGGGLAAFVGVEHRLLATSLRTLGHSHWWWLLAALLAEVASMAALARMQRHLLALGGARLRARSATAVVYASNAISGTVPLAGPEMGTAFAYRQYQRHGADRVTTAWMLAVSGVVSSVTFAVVVAAGAVVSGDSAAVLAGAGGAVALVAAMVAVLAAWHHPASHARLRSATVAVVVVCRRMLRRGGTGPEARADAEARVDAAVAQVSAYHLGWRDWTWVSGAGLVNWIADAACLAMALRVVGAHVPWSAVGLVWAAGAGAGTVRITPGGVGTVEPAMVAALAAAGLDPALGLTAVLAYRLVSFWGMVLIGWSVQAVGQIRGRLPVTAPAQVGAQWAAGGAGACA